MSKGTPKAFVLLVRDHADHGVGCSESALDVSARVSWAWEAVQTSTLTKSGTVGTLQLDVRAGSVNSSKKGRYADLLRKSFAEADKLVPLMAKAWDTSAPSTLVANVAEKLGTYDKIKHLRAVLEEEGKDVDVTTVQEACSLPMMSLSGAKRAALAMLVASVFAADLSQEDKVPVLVLGRPPGHHATCAHCLKLEAAPHSSPGGPIEGRGMGGGCFYPNCWVAAVHSLRQCYAKRLAYIDLDAHKPDGIWKEVERLRSMPKVRRAELMGRADAFCESVYFASVHVDGYPNPGGSQAWESFQGKLPKTNNKAFEVHVVEELLQGVDEAGNTPNEEVLLSYEKWKTSVLAGLAQHRPNGVFIGMGFDLHKNEERINDKRVGIGLSAQHYAEFLQGLSKCSDPGPVVLTLEGGYTKSAVRDGVRGALTGMVALSQARRQQAKAAPQSKTSQSSKVAASKAKAKDKRTDRVRASSDTTATSQVRKRLRTKTSASSGGGNEKRRLSVAQKTAKKLVESGQCRVKKKTKRKLANPAAFGA